MELLFALTLPHHDAMMQEDEKPKLDIYHWCLSLHSTTPKQHYITFSNSTSQLSETEHA
jgi:hypothetical protein